MHMRFVNYIVRPQTPLVKMIAEGRAKIVATPAAVADVEDAFKLCLDPGLVPEFAVKLNGHN